MLLFVVLLAQVLASSDYCPPILPPPTIRELHRTWENANSACRKLPLGSIESDGAYSRRELLASELSRLGWCPIYLGLEIKWEMCPR